jgi:DNA-binding IclR family transcriptional regulator
MDNKTTILGILLSCPGARAQDLAEVTGLSLDAVCSALVELMDAGQVKADANGVTYRRVECPSPAKRWA